MCMYVDLYVYMCAYYLCIIYVYLYVYVQMCVRVFVYVYVYMYVYMYMCMYVCMYVCMYELCNVYICVCMHVCYICTKTCSNMFSESCIAFHALVWLIFNNNNKNHALFRSGRNFFKIYTSCFREMGEISDIFLKI